MLIYPADKPEKDRGAKLGLPSFQKIVKMFESCERIATGSAVTIRHAVSEKYGPPLPVSCPALKTMMQLYNLHQDEFRELLDGTLPEPAIAVTVAPKKSNNKGATKSKSPNNRDSGVVHKQQRLTAPPDQQEKALRKPSDVPGKKKKIPEMTPSSTATPQPSDKPRQISNSDSTVDAQVRNLVLSKPTTTSYEELNKVLTPAGSQDSGRVPPVKETPIAPVKNTPTAPVKNTPVKETPTAPVKKATTKPLASKSDGQTHIKTTNNKTTTANANLPDGSQTPGAGKKKTSNGKPRKATQQKDQQRGHTADAIASKCPGEDTTEPRNNASQVSKRGGSLQNSTAELNTTGGNSQRKKVGEKDNILFL